MNHIYSLNFSFICFDFLDGVQVKNIETKTSTLSENRNLNQAMLLIFGFSGLGRSQSKEQNKQMGLACFSVVSPAHI